MLPDAPEETLLITYACMSGPSLFELTIARAIGGVIASALSMLRLSYMVEIRTSQVRWSLMVVEQLFIVLGAAFGFWTLIFSLHESLRSSSRTRPHCQLKMWCDRRLGISSISLHSVSCLRNR
ncbi:hypothetical protein CPC08DRAFT_124873 [Agrocybe pediades]|nr:hypothetical protein CPC08DRAFT_124873 [Agrocybe pediades]